MLFTVIITLKGYFASQLFSFQKQFVVNESKFSRFSEYEIHLQWIGMF